MSQYRPNCSGIVGWNPCRNTRPPHDLSEPLSYIVAVNSYVYVHCNSPDDGSYVMQCPGLTVWNSQRNGCTGFGGHIISPPRLIGPLDGVDRPPQDGIRVTSTRSPMVNSPRITASPHQPLNQFFAGLPSGPPSTLFRPPRTSGDLTSQLTANPCVVDDRGTLSPLRFHPHPDDPSKYLECVPEERL